jgi:hypothetical protein
MLYQLFAFWYNCITDYAIHSENIPIGIKVGIELDKQNKEKLTQLRDASNEFAKLIEEHIQKRIEVGL